MSTTTVQVDTRALTAEQKRQFFHLVERANRGDESAMPELVQILDAVPSLAQQLGSMAAITRAAWMARIAGSQLGLAEAIRLESEALRAELTQPPDGPLERLLVDRLLTCRLHLEYAEGAYARSMDQLSIEWTDAYQRRIDRAQRRYLQAVRTLAQVRRLAVPAALAEQQPRRAAGVRTVA